MDKEQSTEDLQEQFNQAMCKLAELEYMLAQSLDRSAQLNHVIRQQEAQLKILGKSNEAMQSHLNDLTQKEDQHQ